ncbi:Retrovirus-related Pol polyprotein from transposon TNT 1-94 [Gossypium australe]|uniref:Retrovirus-related Pol polyprotein from transposon TNT 1-94 n=1 Tax=Gossypium australe TaxID=47621 RepID=A0A5B6VZC5_9ROSI|nr:Retrovirus-related Pol polyprotein from transposon TNT 1-94 [Gossypium australe]
MHNKPIELIVVDLWGLAPYFSNGKQYYISFVDAFTRHTWIYFLTKKSDALFAFLVFKKQIELLLGCKIKQVQTNGGGEFKSFVPHLQSFGIQHRISCPHTSKQNRLVKRRYCQIVETRLVLLAQALFPLSYWSDAFVTAVHLMNCLPTKALGGLTPIMRLFGKQPNLQSLKSPSVIIKNSFAVEVGSSSPSSERLQFVEPDDIDQTFDTRVQSLPEHVANAEPEHTAGPVDVVESLPSNVHPMVTRSKVGVYNPKIYVAKLSMIEPKSVHEAMMIPS